jgi:hypothetical protein
MRSGQFPGLLVALAFLGAAKGALAQREFRYRNEFSTGEQAQRVFGAPTTHNRNDPQLNAGDFKFEMGSRLDCGKIDLAADFKGQFNELQQQLLELIPQNSGQATSFLARSAFVTMCYAYPTICAQLRHDWLSIQGKLNLRARACAAVDKFIDNQADKGARQLKAEALAKCVERKTAEVKDVAAALSFCQSSPHAGLLLRDFQSGLLSRFSGQKQKVLRSLLSFAKDQGSYEFLSSFLGEIEVGTDGGWVPLFERGLLRPSDVADTFLTKGQSVMCSRLDAVFQDRFTPSGVYETEVVTVIKRKLDTQTVTDLNDLATADRQIACLALGQAIGKVAAMRAASRFESSVATGLLNTAIPEPLRAEYRERAIAAFPAMRQALDGDDVIPSVEQVRRDLVLFAKLQRAKTAMLAKETNRARLNNSIGDSQRASECADSLSCD